MHSRLLLCASSLLLAGCDILDPPVCDAMAGMGVLVELRDSITTAPAAAGATGELVDGSYREELTPAALPDVLSGALESAGTYDVTIRKQGYVTWRIQRVHVRRGRCGVIPVRLTARLRPAA